MINISALVSAETHKDMVVFGVTLTDGTESHNRVVPVRADSTLVAELLGVEYALMAVNPGMVANAKLSIKVPTKGVAAVFVKNDDGSWKKNYTSNADIVNRIREQAIRFRDVECVVDKTVSLSDMIQERFSLIE